MTARRREDAATATVGLAGVGGAGLLRHEALVRSYGERSGVPLKRPTFAAERRLLRHPRGRRFYLAGSALGALSLPAAATGTYRLIRPDSVGKRDQDRPFIYEGLRGSKDALVSRTKTVTEKPPARLVAANYLAGAAIGSAAGGLTQLALRRKVGGHGRALVAPVVGTLTGTAALPLQSRATREQTHGRYEVTPTGVRRAKTKAVRPSSVATVSDTRVQKGLPKAQKCKYGDEPATKRVIHSEGRAYIPVCDKHLTKGKAHAAACVPGGRPDPSNIDRIDEISKMTPRELVRTVPKAYNEVGARAGAHWTVNGLRVADVVDVPSRTRLPRSRAGRLVYTGRTKAANVLRSAAFDVGSINDKDAMARNAIHGHPLFGKRDDDPGASMSRGERRARVLASGPPIPFVGDAIQARTVARLSPEKYSRRSAVQNFTASQAGGFAGNVAGAGLALGAARLSPGFDRKAKAANDGIEGAKNKLRGAVGLEPATGPGLASRAANHPRMHPSVRGAARAVAASPVGRAVARNPGVAAVGALAGGSVGSAAAQQAMYGHIMRRDDKYRARYAKADRPGPKPIPLSRRDQAQLRRRKERSAALSMAGGTTGLSALGATLGSAALRRRPALAARIPKTARALKDVQVPLLTTGAGLGGYNSFTYAAIQHKEAGQVRKALPRIPLTPRLRAPAMRRGYLRQVRYPGNKLVVSTVRGGLG